MNKLWIFNCREVSKLVSRSMETELPWTKRIGIRFHLAMCKYCARFKTQIELVRELMKARKASMAHHKLDSEAKDNIKSLLRSR